MKMSIAIKPIRSFVILCILLFGIFVSHPVYSVEEDPLPPEMSTTIDFLDYVFTHDYDNPPGQTYFPLSVWENYIAEMASNGIKKIYIRVNACGFTLYPTTVGTRYGNLGGYHWSLPDKSQKLINTLDTYDPLTETIRLGHLYGMEVWAWENLWDDVGLLYKIDDPQYASLINTYGNYPLLDPFFSQHKDYYWEIDPCIMDDITTTNQSVAGTGISKIVFESAATSNPCRIDLNTIEIYTSDDNITYTKYLGNFDITATRLNNVNTLTIDNLDLNAKYVKLVSSVDYPSSGYTMVLDTPAGKSQAFDAYGNEITTEWAWNYKTSDVLDFSLVVPAAWDYLARFIGFKTSPPVIEKIVFDGTPLSRTVRVTSSDFDIYTSNDNITYTKYLSSYSVSGSENTLTIDNLSISDKYVKLVSTTTWDGMFTLCMATPRGQCKAFDTNGNEIYTVWTYYEGKQSPETDKLKFSIKYPDGWDYPGYPAAWDYLDRCFGFMVGEVEREPYFLGVSELSIPAAKNYKLAKFAELTDNYSFDGFMLSLRTHSRTIENGNDYGYNQVVRDEFLSRYGIDIYTEEFDKADWQDLKAESVDEFLYAAKQLTQGRPLYISGLKNRDAADPVRSGYEVFGDLPWHYSEWFADDSIDGVIMAGAYFPEYFTPEITGGKAIKIGMLREMMIGSRQKFAIFMDEYCTSVPKPVISRIVFESAATSSACRMDLGAIDIYTSNDNVTFTKYLDSAFTVTATRENDINILTIDNLYIIDKYVKLVNNITYPTTGFTMILDDICGKSKAFDINGNEIYTQWTWEDKNSPETDSLDFTRTGPAAWDYNSRNLGFKMEFDVISKIVFESAATPNACRMDLSAIDIYTSNDNVTYTKYPDNDFIVTTLRDNGVNTLTIDNLNIIDKYVKLVSTTSYPTTNYSMIMDDICGKSKAFDINGNEIYTQWTWGDIVNPGTDSLNFMLYGPAAWDYNTRCLGFKKTAPAIEKIVFESQATPNPCRLDLNTIDIYISNDNVNFTKYLDNNFIITTARDDGVNTLTVDNLNITSRYVKLVNTISYPLTGFTMIMDAVCGKSKAFDVNGNEVSTQWTWENKVNPETDPLDFTRTGPAAWDYSSRCLGFKVKAVLDEIELYETMILTKDPQYYDIITNYLP